MKRVATIAVVVGLLFSESGTRSGWPLTQDGGAGNNKRGAGASIPRLFVRPRNP
jgi:hypothetical protein